MNATPVLAIGGDRAWRTRIARMLCSRGDLDWCGGFEPGEVPRGLPGEGGVVLIDGDDGRFSLSPRRIAPGDAHRVCFFRMPTVSALLLCVLCGANGCLDKQAPPVVVLRALRATGAGLFATDPQLLQELLRGQGALLSGLPAGGDEWANLTRRQREIVHWAAKGLSNKQIGRRLGISPETVKTHLHHVFEREGVSSRVALAARYRRAGIAG